MLLTSIETNMNQTQHDAAVEIAAHIDEFRKQFPHDGDRLLREYAGCYSKDQVEGMTDEIRDEMSGEAEELEARIEELEARVEELENTKEEEEE